MYCLYLLACPNATFMIKCILTGYGLLAAVHDTLHVTEINNLNSARLMHSSPLSLLMYNVVFDSVNFG